MKNGSMSPDNYFCEKISPYDLKCQTGFLYFPLFLNDNKNGNITFNEFI